MMPWVWASMPPPLGVEPPEALLPAMVLPLTVRLTDFAPRPYTRIPPPAPLVVLPEKVDLEILTSRLLNAESPPPLPALLLPLMTELAMVTGAYEGPPPP